MSKAFFVVPGDCMKTLCPKIDRDYLSRIFKEGFDPMYGAVLGLARKYKTHILYIRANGVYAVLCSEEDKLVADVVSDIMRGPNEAIMRRKDCIENVWRNAQSMEPDAVAKALKECVNGLVNDLSKLDEGIAKAIGEVLMRSIPLVVNRILKTHKSAKLDKAFNEFVKDAYPLFVSLLEKTLTRALGARNTVISLYKSATERVMIVVEDGKARVIQLDLTDIVERSHEGFRKLAEYFPDVFSVDCGDCPHAGLARLVWMMRKDRDFPLLARLVVWYLLSDNPTEVREKVAEAMSTPEDLLALISLTHSLETGHSSAIYMGDTPTCISILTCEIPKEFYDEAIDKITSTPRERGKVV